VAYAWLCVGVFWKPLNEPTKNNICKCRNDTDMVQHSFCYSQIVVCCVDRLKPQSKTVIRFCLVEYALNVWFWPGAAKSDDEIGDSLTTAQWPAPDLKRGLISRSLIAGAGQLRSFEQANKCSECASFVRVIASSEDPAVIQKILAHLDEKAATVRLPPCWAPPVTRLPD
jgi:hypothetical protein